MDFIYDHLEDDISTDRIADVACLSSYHWHRIYTAMRGETMTGTIRRLRLSRAADRLANSNMELSSIAERSGYGSTDAFARAFRDSYGLTPATYRAGGSHVAFKAATQSLDAIGFPVEVQQLPQMRCAAVAHRGSYLLIGQAMARLIANLGAQAQLPEMPTMIGVFLDDPDLVAVDALRALACMPLHGDAVLAPPLELTNLRAGPYARLRYKGPYADMKDAYRWFLGVWLPASGHEPDDAPIFEIYLNDPRFVAANDLLTDIHLPLKAP